MNIISVQIVSNSFIISMMLIKSLVLNHRSFYFLAVFHRSPAVIYITDSKNKAYGSQVLSCFHRNIDIFTYNLKYSLLPGFHITYHWGQSNSAES